MSLEKTESEKNKIKPKRKIEIILEKRATLLELFKNAHKKSLLAISMLESHKQLKEITLISVIKKHLSFLNPSTYNPLSIEMMEDFFKDEDLLIEYDEEKGELF